MGIIPARHQSTRFPGKPLVKIDGKTMIQKVWENASQAMDLVVIATDHEKIKKEAENFGGNVIMTSPEHPSGTDRCAEAVSLYEETTGQTIDVVFNIQGDEPLVRPSDIDRCVAKIIEEENADWATLIYKLDTASNDPNTVKVVCDSNGFALYFSRAQIPFDRDGENSIQRFAHIGLYVYKINALKRFASLKSTPLELTEKLEQLRALESGMKIICVKTEKAFPGIDTPEDLVRVNEIISKNPELVNIKQLLWKTNP